MRITGFITWMAIAWLVGIAPIPVFGQATPARSSTTPVDTRAERTASDVLTADEWQRVDTSVTRALAWLAARQETNGSFPTLNTGQPGVTSLALMAFMSHGHVPGDSEYGERLDRAADFILSCQKQNGLISAVAPDGPQISRNMQRELGICSAYSHAISSLLLAELCGMSTGDRAERIEIAVRKALAASLEMQRWPKQPGDRGGWRYIHPSNDGDDSDLSVTSWELMFLRSARNAGFEVPQEPIDQAVAYVRRCYSARFGTFQYVDGAGDHRSRAMAGAGILALAHAGFHNSQEAQRTGDWILRNGFDTYNVAIQFQGRGSHDRYHYALLNCCQGMYQLGGRHWDEFYAQTAHTVLRNQQNDGSWPADSHWHDGAFGSAYTTSLVVISLGAPNQLLPIFQR